MFIDIHSHPNDEKLINRVEEIIHNAQSVGVQKIVCVGYDYASSLKAIELSQKFKNIYATVGLHPNNCFEFDEKMENLILSSAKNPKIVAIGEIGLDYYDIPYQLKEANLNISEEKFIERQKEIFTKQIELANKINLPIMIHMRDTTEDTIKILENNKSILKNGGLFHCYNGSLETTEKIFKLGFYISLGGAITFKNSKNMPEVLKKIGLTHVCLETDSPYLSPEPFRGQLNEPKNISLVAQKISEILNKNVSEIEEITTKSCYTVFNKLKD